MSDLPTCEWKWDWRDSSWDGTCGAKWLLEVEGPKANGMNFCPVCGKPLVEIETVEDEDE